MTAHYREDCNTWKLESRESENHTVGISRSIKIKAYANYWTRIFIDLYEVLKMQTMHGTQQCLHKLYKERRLLNTKFEI